MASADVNPFVGSLFNDPSSPGPTVNTGAQDDLFDYDAGADEIFRDVDINMDVPTGEGRPAPDSKNARTDNAALDGLGIDEEIKVSRKKRVNVKLDEGRLLSQAGIPKLRRISKERLKFKGKGHEFSDISRLLSFYQLWLDDLFPKAKFADALAIIEKLGHSRRLQVMRREWMEEDKPKPASDVDDNPRSPAHDANRPMDPANPTEKDSRSEQTVIAAQDRNPPARLETPPVNSADDDDLYDATPLVRRTAAKPLNLTLSALQGTVSAQAQGPQDEDFEAFLAEDMDDDIFGQQGPIPPTNSSTALREESVLMEGSDIDDDELEAMREMESMR